MAVGWLGLHHCLFNNAAQAGLGPQSFGEEEEVNTTKQLLQGSCTLAVKGDSIGRASAVTQTHPLVMDAGQSLTPWMGWAVLKKVQDEGQRCVSVGACHGSALCEPQGCHVG